MSLSLHDKALVLVKNYKRAEYELIQILSQIDKTKGFLQYGASSLFVYCIKALQLSESETGRFIQVMRKSQTVPELKTALSSGLLTVSKASRIAAVIDTSNSSEWITKVMTLTQRDVEREVAAIHPKVIPRETLRVLSGNRTELKLSISVVLEEKLRRAQAVLRKKTLEETLESALDLLLQQKDPVLKAARYIDKALTRRKSKTTTTSPLLRNTAGKPKTGPHPSRETAVKLTNDSHPSTETERHKRSPIPASVKHQVFSRDRGRCTYQGCGETHWVDLHHYKLVSQGGTNTLSNLSTLCWAHHKFLHEKAKAP